MQIGHIARMADVLDELELKVARLNLECERDEVVRLRALIEEIRSALRAPGSADDKVRWLIDRLGV